MQLGERGLGRGGGAPGVSGEKHMSLHGYYGNVPPPAEHTHQPSTLTADAQGQAPPMHAARGA